MTSKAASGSAYHLSSLRYAEGTSSVPHAAPLTHNTSRSRLDELFEKAEDDYRPGQSSSSSLLIRSNVLALDGTIAASEEQAQARDGFLRTKARAVLANSVPTGDLNEDDAQLGIPVSELGSSIYIRNRRARNPLTREKYEKLRTKKRLIKEKAKQMKARGRGLQGEGAEAATLEDENDPEIRDQEKSKAERIKMEMQVDADALISLLPSGSLMETIHYLAAHYYDARGMLTSRDGTGARRSAGLNMGRVCEGSALVALGIYLEEVAKFQMTASGSDELHQDADAGKKALLLADRLAKIRRKTARDRRKGKIKKVAGKMKKRLIANGWAAKERRRRRTKPAAALEGSESEETEAEEEEEEQHDSEEDTSSDGIDGIDEGGSRDTEDTGEEG